MRKISKALKFLLLLNKRLLKRPSFLAVLLVIPIVSLLVVMMAGEEGGIVKIALAGETKKAASGAIIEKLMSDDGLISFELYETEDKALAAVSSSKADAAWIFPEESDKDYKVRVIEREETIPLRLSHEKLSAAVYSEASKELYISFIRGNVKELSEMSDGQLEAFYESGADGDYSDLFEFSSSAKNEKGESNFLKAPVRGILAVLVIFAGLGIACLYMIDDKNGLFIFYGAGKRMLIAIFYQLVCMLPAAVVAFVSILISGLSVSFFRELGLMLLLLIPAAGLCLVLRLLFKRIEIFGAVLPLIVIVLLALSPIFLDFNGAFFITKLLPTYYYINAVHNDAFILPLAIYGVVSLLVYAVGSKLLKRA